MSASQLHQRNALPPGVGYVPVLLFISGALALVYEIIWQRQFALVFGSAAPAIAAVLAAYFAGLGLGALVIGRVAKRWKRPLRVYAVLEVCVGLGALMVSPLLGWFDAAYPWFVDTFSSYPPGFTAVRTALAFLTLLIPTFCMGGTLPILGELVDRTHQQLGITVGWLYIVNTVGAGAGALLVPFFLMPRLGLAGTVYVGAAANGILALAAWWLDRGLPSASSLEVKSVKVPKRSAAPQAVSAERAGPVLLLALISGAVTFALQVLWNRAFAQVHENSMYSFSVTVAVVIFALAIGGQLARVGLRRGIHPRRLIGVAWTLGGIAVLFGPWLFLRVSGGMSYLPAGGGWLRDSFQLIRMAGALLLIPLALLGIGLPAIMEQAGRSSDLSTSRLLGRLLAANVLGSVTGALVAGFVLPGWLGLWGGIMWLGALIVIAGVWQWTGRAEAGAHRRMGLALAAGWLASSVFFGRIDIPRVRLAPNGTETLLSLAEGSHGITAVVEHDGARRLKLNNFYGLGGTKATADERMQAHLPLLLHPAPERVAFLGMGTGITAGGSLYHPVQHVTVMELVPEVVDAARAHFSQANNDLLNDPRAQLITDDARHYLRGSGERFDVIVGDLVVPWRQGEGSLFTLEQFEAAQRALKPGGLFCQWLPLFQLSEVELNILLRTFLTVFPRAEMWRGDFAPNEPAIALVSRGEDFRMDVSVIQRRLEEMRLDPANAQLRAPGIFWMHRIGMIQMSDLLPDETRLNREDRPWIELLGPMLHAGGDQDQLFTGRRLQAWVEKIRHKSDARTGSLPLMEAAGVEAGAIFNELVLCLAEGNTRGAEAAQDRLRQTLPEASFQQLMGP